MNAPTNVPMFRGLGATGIRWDLLALTFGLAFAGVLGYRYYKRRK